MTFLPSMTPDEIRNQKVCCVNCDWRGTGAEASPKPDSLLTCPLCGRPVTRDEGGVPGAEPEWEVIGERTVKWNKEQSRYLWARLAKGTVQVVLEQQKSAGGAGAVTDGQ